jgi:hypothetical protein
MSRATSSGQEIIDDCKTIYEAVLCAAKEGPKVIDAIVGSVIKSINPANARRELASIEPIGAEFMLRTPSIALTTDGWARCRLDVRVHVETNSNGTRGFDAEVDFSVCYAPDNIWYVSSNGWSNEIRIGRDPSAHEKSVERIVDDIKLAVTRSALTAGWETAKQDKTCTT